jgi:hypothetical protein
MNLDVLVRGSVTCKCHDCGQGCGGISLSSQLPVDYRFAHLKSLRERRNRGHALPIPDANAQQAFACFCCIDFVRRDIVRLAGLVVENVIAT